MVWFVHLYVWLPDSQHVCAGVCLSAARCATLQETLRILPLCLGPLPAKSCHLSRPPWSVSKNKLLLLLISVAVTVGRGIGEPRGRGGGGRGRAWCSKGKHLGAKETAEQGGVGGKGV